MNNKINAKNTTPPYDLHNALAQTYVNSLYTLHVKVDGTHYDAAYSEHFGDCITALCESVTQGQKTGEPIEGFEIVKDGETVFDGTFPTDGPDQKSTNKNKSNGLALKMDESHISQWREGQQQGPDFHQMIKNRSPGQ